MALSATCVQRLNDSRDYAIHTKYHISLHSSSMQEPRYPLPRVVCVDETTTMRPIGTEAMGACCFVVRSLGAFCVGVHCSLERAAASHPSPMRRARQQVGLPGPPVLFSQVLRFSEQKKLENHKFLENIFSIYM